MNLEDDDKGMCVACVGTGAVYDGLSDEYTLCPYCGGDGEATPEENESYLSTININ